MSVQEKEKQEALDNDEKTGKESHEKRNQKIFLSGSIRGGRQLLPVYRLIYETLEGSGAEVVSWHVVDPELEKVESAMTEEEIYARDIGLLSKSDAVLAELRSLPWEWATRSAGRLSGKSPYSACTGLMLQSLRCCLETRTRE